MILWFVGSSPASGCVLTAQSLEPALDSVSPSLSAHPRLMLCLSKMNVKKKKKQFYILLTFEIPILPPPCTPLQPGIDTEHVVLLLLWIPSGQGSVRVQLFRAGGGGSEVCFEPQSSGDHTPASRTTENTPSLEAVAEQAESIDNPLHEAAKRGNLSWLRECLDNRVGVNGLDKAGSTALYWACHGGHKDIVEMLFTQPNIELNQQNKLGDTALHAAAWKGYADIVHLLLEKGARTDLRNNEKKLALDMATNAACASLLKKKQGTDAVRTLSNAEEYLDDEDSD
uniref:Osteoclast stimulating factor 1 n=1 Tax=Felis catus TaxID=9685 RepID=A0ABI7YNR4_FELCA